MFQLLIISILITSSYGEDNDLIVRNTPRPPTIYNNVKANLEADPFATRLITEIWNNPPNNTLADLLHIVFSQAYIYSQLFASQVQGDDLTLVLIQDPDIYQEEYGHVIAHDSQVRTKINNRIQLIVDKTSGLLNNQVLRPHTADGKSKVEDIFTLLDFDSLLNSFRRHTIFNLLLEQYATLELEYPNTLNTFPSDTIFWNKDRLQELLWAYPGDNRKFLSEHKQRFLILRSTLQTLFNGRLHRLDSKKYYQQLDNKITDVTNKITDLSNGVTAKITEFSSEINALKTKMDNAHRIPDD